MSELNIAEIPYDSGEVHFRYSRYLSDDGEKWIRHGLFCAYHKNGALSSEGNYKDGFEDGLWRDYHENGQLAAEGVFLKGKEFGTWRYWDVNGVEEQGE